MRILRWVGLVLVPDFLLPFCLFLNENLLFGFLRCLFFGFVLRFFCYL